MPDSPVLAALYLLAAAHQILYLCHQRRFPVRPDRPRYRVSAMTRAFRYLVVLLFVAVLIEATLALLIYERDPVPPGRFAAGFALCVVALVLLGWSLAALGPNFAACHEGRLPDTLVRHGPYRHLRHPTYHANLLLLLGFNIVLLDWVIWAILGVLAVFDCRAILDEDLALRAPGGRA
jgi:protein-S-isoprenylcysteine O-methyltransferase Ste14